MTGSSAAKSILGISAANFRRPKGEQTISRIAGGKFQKTPGGAQQFRELGGKFKTIPGITAGNFRIRANNSQNCGGEYPTPKKGGRNRNLSRRSLQINGVRKMLRIGAISGPIRARGLFAAPVADMLRLAVKAVESHGRPVLVIERQKTDRAGEIWRPITSAFRVSLARAPDICGAIERLLERATITVPK
jgi:hypothetical protein